MSRISALKIEKNAGCQEEGTQLKLDVMDAGELGILLSKKQVRVYR